MAVEDRFVGKGAVVEISTDGVAYQPVESVLSITPVGENNTEIDITAIADAVASAVPGLPQPTQFNYTDYPNYNSASSEIDIEAARAANTLLYWKMTLVNADGSLEAAFQGYVMSHTHPPMTGTDRFLRDVVVTKVGGVTWTYTPNP